MLAAAAMLCSVMADIVPGSKNIGAAWFVGDSITQSNADGDATDSPGKALYELLTTNGAIPSPTPAARQTTSTACRTMPPTVTIPATPRG